MRYKRLETVEGNIPDWWIVNFTKGLVAINNDYRPKFKMKLSRKGKSGK